MSSFDFWINFDMELPCMMNETGMGGDWDWDVQWMRLGCTVNGTGMSSEWDWDVWWMRLGCLVNETGMYSEWNWDVQGMELGCTVNETGMYSEWNWDVWLFCSSARGRQLILTNKDTMDLIRRGIAHSDAAVAMSALKCVTNLALPEEDNGREEIQYISECPFVRLPGRNSVKFDFCPNFLFQRFRNDVRSWPQRFWAIWRGTDTRVTLKFLTTPPPLPNENERFIHQLEIQLLRLFQSSILGNSMKAICPIRERFLVGLMLRVTMQSLIDWLSECRWHLLATTVQSWIALVFRAWTQLTYFPSYSTSSVFLLYLAMSRVFDFIQYPKCQLGGGGVNNFLVAFVVFFSSLYFQ